MRTLALLASALVLAPAAALASDPGMARPGFLPPDAMILDTLEATPQLAEARALLGAARADQRILNAGEHETVFTAAFDDRRVRKEGNYSEWSVQAARGLRLPGKAEMDRAAGRAGLKAAEDSVDDARHQASLVLIDRWLSWAEAAGRRALAEAELATYAREAAALARRVELKDAAPLDLDQARGAEARARAAAAQAAGAEAAARADVEMMFPGLAPANAPELSPPAAPDRPFQAWTDIILERSHEITIARALADRERFLATRVRRDRLPDPTLGVRTFSERGGEESGIGLFVSIPFSGPRRSAAADRQAAEASAAEARFAMVARDVRATARGDVIAASAALDAWNAANGARAASEQTARRIARAYELGERDLSDRLLAERQDFEARRAELAARAEAHKRLLRMALDAHELWLSEEQ
ncbi:MAG: transporter [Phenylobacterium sp.]|uniref:TolC family protein n=1 Tax=Phenylobacterium sp. TaxID=1871053 RepID=UPI0025E6AF99|nr:TolC family protein [Phenylobacterium sp.]MBI1200248.1 transporter [Phenylobacterium sp.]